MKHLIAIDGGGTKTDIVLFTETGSVTRRVLTGGCNPNDFGWTHAEETLREGLRQLLPVEEQPLVFLDAVFAGVSGGSVGDHKPLFHALLRRLLPHAARIGNDSDVVSALSSGVGQADGCVVVSGTGSVGLLRSKGTLRRVGGWGYLFDRGGSGYDLGRDAVYTVLCAADGRGAATRLTPLLADKLGKPVTEAIPALYEQGKPAIAALAPLVFVAAAENDPAAVRILEQNGQELARLFNTLYEAADATCLPTVLTGSVFKNWSVFSSYVLPHLRGRHTLIFPELPPVYGSAVEAMALLRLPTDAGFKERFAASLAQTPA